MQLCGINKYLILYTLNVIYLYDSVHFLCAYNKPGTYRYTSSSNNRWTTRLQTHTHTHTQVYRSFPRPLDLRRICLVNNVTVARLCVQMARVYYIYINMIIKRYLCKITRIRLACAPRDEVPEPSR